MGKKPIKEVFMSFAAEESQMEDIRSSIRDVLADSDLTTKDVNSVLLALEEGCTNVIRHAYLYGPGTIRIKVKLYPGKVQFSIFDRGRAFDFDHSDVPNLDRYVKTGRKGGLGLYLIRKMMDSVDYHSRDGENELRMEKISDKTSSRSIRIPGFSIRVKFALWASLVVFMIVAGVFYYFDNRGRKNARERFFDGSTNAMETFVSDIGDKILLRDLDLNKSAASWLDANKNLFSFIVVTDTGGIIIADPESPSLFLSAFRGIDSGDYNTDIAVKDSLNNKIFYYKRAARINDQTVGYAYFGLRESPLKSELSQTRTGLLLIAFAGLFVGFMAVYALSNYFVKPIQKLTEGVLRFGEGNLDQSLPVDGSDEFSEIARAFNEITGKFKKAQENVVEQERLQKEMQVAQEIQHTLLPRTFPDIEGYDIATVYRAAKDVGGDYFDFVRIDENTLGIIVADVSGKGIPGSLVMTMIRTALRMEARGNFSPIDILSRVNNFVADDVKKGMFITIFFIMLNSESRAISFSSAGHNPMILYRKESNSCYFLNPRGMPLGISLPDGVSFEKSLESDKVQLKKDDMLIVYTDGITEAMNKLGEQFGNDRLIQFIRDNSDLHPKDFASKLDFEINKFTGGAPQNDDITLVVIKEKLMLDEVIFQKRRRLIEMVEKEGVPLEEACTQMGVSTSTYYKYLRRWQKLGDMGLLNKKLRAETNIKQISTEVRKEILKIVREDPELGGKRILQKLSELGIQNIDIRGLYLELVRMRLNTKKLRLEYVERVGGSTPEIRAELEKEILKEVSKKEEFDRVEYIETIKKNLDQKKEQLGTSARGLVSKLQQMEPVLGDASLYGEIAAELGKLGEGEDIAKLFENLILKMAYKNKGIEKSSETEIPAPATIKPMPDLSAETPVTAGIVSEEDSIPKIAPNDSNSEIAIKPETVAPIQPLPEQENTPIDVIENASKPQIDEEKKDEELDWDDYGKKLVEKFKKE